MRVQEIRTAAERGGRRKSFVVAPGTPTPPAGGAFLVTRPKQLLEDPEPDHVNRFINPALLVAHTQGETQYLNFAAIPSNESFPTPTFTGGVQSLQLFIAGVLIPLFNPAGAGSGASACSVISQTIGRSTATLDIWVSDGSYFPVVGQTVLITELGITLFAGCIDTIVAEREIGTVSGLTFHVTALDKSSICDRRVVTAATYAAGTDAASVIQQITDSFLNGEGINTNGVPTDGSLGTLTSDLVFNYNTVTDAFNQIQTLAGAVWWIDQYGTLFFSTESNLPLAPFQLNESTTNVSPGGGSSGAATVTTTLSGAGSVSGYRNKQYVVTNLNILPGSGSGGGASPGQGVTETFTFSNGSPGVSSDYNPSGVLVPIFIDTSLPIATVLSITVNGVDQSFYEITQSTGQQYLGGTDYVWYYASTNTFAGQGGSNQYATAQGVLAIPSGATVVITYVPGTNTSSSAAQVGTALVPIGATGGTFGTCGSGIFEAVLQVKNISNQDDLNAIAAAELAKSGGIPQILDVYTNKPSLFVGQMVEALFPKLGMPGTGSTPVSLLITKVSGTASARPLNYGSFFTWRIEAVTNLDPGNWITYFTNMIQRSANALPVLQAEVKTWVLAPSGSLAAGVVTTNPQYMALTGRAVEVYGGAGSPPTGQDLQITITDVTQGYIIGQFVIPAGSTAQVTTTIDPALNLYGYAKDTLTVTATYINVGGSPVAAANVTVCARFVH